MKAVVTAGLLCSPLVLAQADALPIYVSDRFRVVAEKTARQVGVELIENACPAGKPFCKTLVASLADAATAASEKDNEKLRGSLNEFFIASSTSGLLEATTGDLFDSSGTEGAGLGKALAPIARCLNAVVTRSQVGEQCKFTGEEVTAIRAAIANAVCRGKPDSCADAERVRSALEQKPVNAGEIARALAAVVRKLSVPRQDLEFYLSRVADFLEQHPENGLFDAAFAFLATRGRTHAETSFLDEDYSAYLLFNAAALSAVFRPRLAGCNSGLAALETWNSAAPAVAKSIREALLSGQRPAVEAVTTLSKVDGSACSEEARAALVDLKRYVQTLVSQVEFASKVDEFGVLGLVAAAAIDFARSGNEVVLDADLRRTVLFATAQAMAHDLSVKRFKEERSGGGAPESATRITDLTQPEVRDIEGLCEFQRLAALEGLPFEVDSATTPHCVSAAGAQQIPIEASRLTAIASGTDVGRRALDDFADLLQRERVRVMSSTKAGPKSSQLLGYLATQKSDAASWKRIKADLDKLVIYPGDESARRDLQAYAVELATKPPDVPAGIEGVNPPQFTEKVIANKAITLPSTQRVVAAPGDQTPEQRVLAFYAQARALLDAVRPEIAATMQNAGVNLELIAQAVAAGANNRPAASRKFLLNAGTEFLVAQVDAFTTRLIGADANACAGKDGQWRFLFVPLQAACGAKILIDSAYKPIAEFLWAEDFTFTGDKVEILAEKSYRSLIAVPGLEHTPIILDVGLGFNAVLGRDWSLKNTGHPEQDGFVALTVLDKIGLAVAKYSSKDTRFETGVFVGGFLDAIVRTATGSPDRYWLAGATAGWTRMFGVDLGLELNVAAAFPFEFHSDPRLAVGATIVVPFSNVFE